ncbi:hypothetical protein U0070_019012, partial [Myodes glareolus]
MKDKYKVGELLKFSCRQGHRVGSDSVQCYYFGWSPSFPTCKEEMRTCTDIPKLEHGSVRFFVPPYYHGDSVEFTCKETFTMIGHGSVSCIRGRWTQLPQCVATDQLGNCKTPMLADMEAIHAEKIGYIHNVILIYKCRGMQKYKFSICFNGFWIHEPTCIRKESCPPPPQIPNAQIMETTVKYSDGEKVSVLCQDNYITQDTEAMVCKDGRWQSLPRCIAKIPCSQPPKIDYGSIKLPRLSEERGDTAESRSYKHGTTLSYVCDDGFRMIEEHGVTCHMGKWSAPPRCVGLPCGPPPSVLHGIVHPELDSYQHGAEVTYSCSEGFGIDGPAFIKCIGGKWPQPPYCKRTNCYSLPRFKNAIPTEEEKYSYRSGEQMTFKCVPSYQMVGSNIVTCVNGKWIGELVCK